MFEEVIAERLSDPQKTLVLAHYTKAAPLMALDFPHVPLLSSYHPKGLGTPAVFKHTWAPDELPETLSAVDVVTNGQHRTYLALTENAVLWLAHRGAVGMLSWTPNPRDPECVGYARILLRRCGTAGEEELKYALLALRTALTERGLQAIPVLEGHDGAALFVPFGDIPLYDAVRAWLHTFCAAAAQRHGALLTVAEDDDERGNRVHLSVRSNAVGQCSSVPYSLMGDPKLRMVTPIEWSELATVGGGTYTARNSATRLERDVFAEMTVDIGLQRFSAVR